MRINTISAAALAAFVLGFGGQKAAADQLVARFHFMGTKQLAADPKALKLQEIGALPQTTELRDKVLEKLATAPFRYFQTNLVHQSTNNYAELIRPLLQDLLESESYAEMRGPTNHVPELMVAVHLDDARAALWQHNLSMVLAAWTGIPVKEISGDGYKGWELKKHHDPNLLRCLRAGEWVLFGWGADELQLQPGFLQRIKDTKRPVEPAKNEFLEAMVDWPAITPYHPIALPALLPYKLPKMHLTVQARKAALGYDVRPELVMQFPEPLNLKLEPWRLPIETIRNPMVSFTAIRGITPWLNGLEAVKQLQPAQVPDQLCLWAMSAVPFETYVAGPVKNSSNFLAELEPRLLPKLNTYLSKQPVITEAVWTNNRVLVTEMPFLSPSLRAVHEKEGDFLLGALFVTPPRKNIAPFPKDLLHELNSKPNLVYYDWELNTERIYQWSQLQRIQLMLTAKPVPGSQLAGQKWLTAVRTNLGNCGTEITLTAPNELKLIRNGPLGLTGFELNKLMLWIDAPGFPMDARYEFPKRPAGLRPRGVAPAPAPH